MSCCRFGTKLTSHADGGVGQRTVRNTWARGVGAATDSGSGSLYAAVGGVAGTGFPLGLIPLGTGNDWGAHVGLPIGDPAAAARVILAGRTRDVDVGRAVPLAGGPRPILFNCVAGIGLDADAIRHLRAAPWIRGNVKYAYGGLRALLSYRPRAATVTAEGFARTGPVMFVAVTNTRTYGGGMLVSPDADLADGRLDVCVVGRMDRLRMLLLFPRIHVGGHLRVKGVCAAQSPWVELRSDEPMPLCLDGEFTDITTPVRLEALPAALRVWAP